MESELHVLILIGTLVDSLTQREMDRIGYICLLVSLIGIINITYCKAECIGNWEQPVEGSPYYMCNEYEYTWEGANEVNIRIYKHLPIYN